MDQSQSCAQCFISHWILEKRVAGKWLQYMLMWSKLSPLGYRHPTSVFTLECKPWYHCGANAKMVVVTMLLSDVFHPLHMCHVLISHNNILTWQCLLPYFLKVLCKYIAVWVCEFIHIIIIIIIIIIYLFIYLFIQSSQSYSDSRHIKYIISLKCPKTSKLHRNAEYVRML